MIFGAGRGVVNEPRVQGLGQITYRDTKDVENDGQNIVCVWGGGRVVKWQTPSA